jgi:ribonuclease HI
MRRRRYNCSTGNGAPKLRIFWTIKLVMMTQLVTRHGTRSMSTISLPQRAHSMASNMFYPSKSSHARNPSFIFNVVNRIPSRTFSVNDDKQLLTRTMVRRMRVSDLKAELERRGCIAGTTTTKMKRTELMDCLLLEISKPKNKEYEKASHRPIDNSCTTSTVGKDVNLSLPSTQPPTQNISIMPEPEMKPWVNKYCISNVKLDPTIPCEITVTAVTKTSEEGVGIGITMQECQSHTILWKAQKFYPRYRSIFEANYSGIILAVRYALQYFQLKSIHIYIPEFTIYDQLTGLFQITKPSLRALNEEITALIDEHDEQLITWKLMSKEQRTEVSLLAQDALNNKTSLNLGDVDDNNHLTIDPMDGVKSSRITATNELEHDIKYRDVIEVNNESINPSATYILRFDGGSRGNPGLAGAGMVIYDSHEREIWHGWKYLGRNMSNNLAEYTAINLGLQHAQSMGIERIRCEGDSLLIVKQLSGSYKVKSENLITIFAETQNLMKKFKSCEVKHIRRNLNKRADELANEGASKDYKCVLKYIVPI